MFSSAYAVVAIVLVLIVMFLLLAALVMSANGRSLPHRAKVATAVASLILAAMTVLGLALATA